MFKTRASTMLMDEAQMAPIMEGWIQKRSPKGNDRWQRRYLILRRDWIAWSKQRGSKPAGIIPLATIIYVAHLETEGDGIRFDFIVQGAEQRHTFYWSADTKLMAATWCQRLKELTRAANAGLVTQDFQRVIDTTGKFWKNTVDISLRLRSTSASEYTGVTPLVEPTTPANRATSPPPSTPTHMNGLPPQSPIIANKQLPLHPSTPTATTSFQPHQSPVASARTFGSGAYPTPSTPTASSGSGQYPSSSPSHTPRRTDVKPLAQGFLKKKSPKGVGWKVWQTRLFMLYEDALVYFKKKDGKPTGAIPLAVITQIQPLGKKDGCRVDLICVEDGKQAGRTVALLANSKKQRDQWVIAIEKALIPIRAKNPLPITRQGSSRSIEDPIPPVHPSQLKLAATQRLEQKTSYQQPSFLAPVSIQQSDIGTELSVSASHLSLYRDPATDSANSSPTLTARDTPSLSADTFPNLEKRQRPMPPPTPVMTPEQIAARAEEEQKRAAEAEAEAKRMEDIKRQEEIRIQEEKRKEAERIAAAQAKRDQEIRKMEMISDIHAVALERRALIVDDSSDDESDFGDDDFGRD